MKKLLIAFVAIIATTLSLNSCGMQEDTVMGFSALPAAAQETIVNHFGEENVMLVVFETALFDTEYVVTLFDGTVIEFDKNGAWDSIEAYSAGVPKSIMLDAIVTYLDTYYADVKVVELEKDSTGYELKLENMMELEFSLTGTLTGASVD